jgi:hypothetical protein
MSWIKNIVLYFFSIAFITLLCNFLVGVYLHDYKTSLPYALDDNAVKFYRKYENQVNHLRDPSLRSKAAHLNQTSDLLFSSLSQQDANYSVLITGDSWGEKFATDVDSYQTLSFFSKSEHVNFTLSGTSSYSPTLLGVQSHILKRDFDLSFNAAFILVDNTDIGDELCRYRSVVEVAQNGSKIVKKFGASDKMAAYFLDNELYINEVLNSDDYALKKLFLLVLKKLGTYKYQNNCGWTEISKYLYEINEEDASYFESSVEYMINEIKRNSPDVSIHILTVPHRKHISEEYKVNTSMLINKVLNNNDFEKVEHHDFSDAINQLLQEGFDLDDIYVVGDKASHLTSFAHNKILVPYIISTIRENNL